MSGGSDEGQRQDRRVVEQVRERRALERSARSRALAHEQFLKDAIVAVSETPLSLHARLLKLAELASTAIGGEHAIFYIADPEGGITDVITWGVDFRMTRWLRRLLVGRALSDFPIAAPLLRGETVVVVDEDREQMTGKLSSTLGVRSYVAVPLRAEPMLGALVVDFGTQRHAFTPDEVALVDALSRHASMAIHNARLYEQAEEARRASERRMAGIGRVHELEAQLLAGELHGGVIEAQAQTLALLDEVRFLLNEGDLDKALDVLSACRVRATEALATARVLASSLRPGVLRKRGLGRALGDLVGAVRSGWDGDVNVFTEYDRCLNDDQELALLRIAQEAVSNARRHAGASSIEIRLRKESDDVVLTVSDDGRGFEAAEPEVSLVDRAGMDAMRERATLAGGAVVVRSAPNRGTTVEVLIPVAPESRQG